MLNSSVYVSKTSGFLIYLFIYFARTLSSRCCYLCHKGHSVLPQSCQNSLSQVSLSPFKYSEHEVLFLFISFAGGCQHGTPNFVFCRSTEFLMVDEAAPAWRSRVTNKDLRTVLSANTFICVCREMQRKLKLQSFAVISPRFLAPPLPPVSHRWCSIRRSHMTVTATCDSSSASSPSYVIVALSPSQWGRQVNINRSLWKHSSK